MRWLIVQANPEASALVAAMGERAQDALGRTHSVRLIDLDDIAYQPCLSGQELANYFELAEDHPDGVVRGHISDVRWAEGIVFVYPTTAAGLPAVMKGWLDRTLIPGVAFTLNPRTQRIMPALTNIRRLAIVTTSAAPTWWLRLVGDGGRTTIARTVRLICHRPSRFTFMSLPSVNSATGTGKEAFLDEVTKRLERL